MPTRKIADLPKICNHPDHNPPMYRVYEPGVYEHECSGCGQKIRFTVHGVRYSSWTGTGDGSPMWGGTGSSANSTDWSKSFNEKMDNAMKRLDESMKTLEKAFEGW